MARICVIHGCKSEYYPDCGLSYHRIPGKETAKQSWLNALPLNSYKQIKENSVICSKHFKPDDYIPGISKAVLKENAIPSVFLLDTTTWLTLGLAVITFATPALTSEPRVVCYYTNWSVYRPGTAKFNPQNINPYLCTHLIYAFGGFTKDNTLKPFDKYQDIEKGGYAKFTGLKTYNKNLKTMLAIGGWNEGSSRFSPMVASKERRKEFVRNAIKFLRQNRFDGLDLDWEYPAFRDGGKPKDRDNYAKLVRELREEFDRESEKTGRPRLLLTMAVPAGIEYIQKGFDVKTLNRYLDWMNLLTYDYHSAFEPAVNHHAPLYPLEEPNEYSVDSELNIDYTIKFYLESGADRDKLVLGIPTYGRSYTLFNADAVEIGSPADGPGEQGDATREKGYLAYYEICDSLKPKTKKRRAIDDDSEEVSEEEEEDEEDLPWSVMHPNPSAMGPVAYRGNQWVGYDDTDIVKKKAEYVAENGLGGIMFWSIDNDDFRGTCHGKPYPLIEAAKEAYIVKLGSTDNAIVTDKPRSTTSRSSSKRRNRPRTSTTTARPSTATKSSKRKSSSVSSTTPSWNVTPEPPTTPDPGSDFKCKDEGFFQHPRDCKKYFWCLDSGPSNLGIVAHQFTCPSGLFFNKAADSCDFARNVLCKIPAATTKAPATRATTTTTTVTTTTTTTRRPIKLSTKSSSLFRTTSTTTPEPEVEEEYEDDLVEDTADIDAEDPRVIKELIDLIKKVGGVEQLEKHLHLSETSVSTDGAVTTTPSSFNKKLYQKVLERTRSRTKLTGNSLTDSLSQNVRRGPQNAGLDATSDKDKLLRRDRPQYTTINRARPSTTAPELEEEESEEQVDEAPQQLFRSRAVESQSRVATTAKPLQYVNIRRAKPTTVTSDTADDTASRNALFERSETYVTVSDSPSPKTLDIILPARDNIPEYVTIRRQRPTTEEPTTAQYQNTEPEEESQETALEREISSPASQPQYTSIIRSRSTTTTVSTPEEITPEPTTVLAVQISSLLNSASSSEVDEPETTVYAETTTKSTTSRPTTTTTTTTTTPAPPPTPPRRQVLRRRGTTTTSTTTTAPVSSTQNIKRPNFLRRTKATSPPDFADTFDTETTSNTTTDTTEIDTTTPTPTTTTITNKFTRRGGSKFKTRTQNEVAKKDAGKSELEIRRRPSLSGSAARSERPVRNFVRRRIGGANATSSTSPSTSSTTVAPQSRRPFRVASRRRPLTATTSTTTTTTMTTEATTAALISEESLQDITDIDSLEDPSYTGRAAKTPQPPRRPLVLKDGSVDQNPSATNEDERKRQSKKYSSSFKQNQLDEVLKRGKEDGVTTEGTRTTVDDFSAETALAIAAHQLLAAPIPNIPNYDEDVKPKKSTTQQYKYNTHTEEYTDTKTPYDEYSSTPIYKTTSQDYVQTGSVYTNLPFDSPRTTTFVTPKSSVYPSTFTSKVSRPSGFSTPNLLTSSLSPTVPSPGPSTGRYLSSSEKLIPVPVEDYGYSTGGYSSINNEPSYFTREYLLESPVTKTYDDEYQYLSPVTTPQSPQTTRKLKKTVQRRISTTVPPTLAAYVPQVSSPQPRKVPARVPSRKPFEKVPYVKVAKDANRTFRPVDNYDYYDEGDEKFAEKYEDGTKVIVHGKGSIECLDIGNFPHPTSCKKFISCARLENGSLLGWEYVCPKGLSFDPVGGICNWSAGLGCDEKDIA